jgi:hypothetical protein
MLKYSKYIIMPSFAFIHCSNPHEFSEFARPPPVASDSPGIRPAVPAFCAGYAPLMRIYFFNYNLLFIDSSKPPENKAKNMTKNV